MKTTLFNKYKKPAKEYPVNQIVIPAFFFEHLEKQLQQTEFILNGKLFHAVWNLDTAECKIESLLKLVEEMQLALELCKKDLIRFDMANPEVYVRACKAITKSKEILKENNLLEEDCTKKS